MKVWFYYTAFFIIIDVNDVSKFDNDFELISDRYTIDAKSIMGIFSLNLAKPICLNIHAEENADQIMNALMGYLV